MMRIASLIIFVLFSFVSSNPTCPQSKPGMVNVHLVCHTHDDVGWLKTVDQYFYGSQKSITWVGVQYILDSVIPSLLKDPSRKFIYVESAFFSRWWNEQESGLKSKVQTLVQNGQLEFVSGGWSMNDEATTHYSAIIDQMTVGLTFLKDVFGSAGKPTVTWQIDPFGHSKEQASLFAQMGMDGLFLGRIDYADKNARWSNKQMEMVWKASDSLGEEAWLFTGVLPNNYSPPSGFCFDLLCYDDPIMDDPDLEDNNAEEMTDRFLQAVTDQQTGYITSDLIMTMGDDFQYMNAEAWFKNLDKLIGLHAATVMRLFSIIMSCSIDHATFARLVNARQNTSGSNVNVMYSTPSCYLEALHASNTIWPTKSDDFFPYASDPHAFWTGYFTSRPTLKGYVRQTSNLLQTSKQIAALAGFTRDSVLGLAEVQAVLQHHDGVTGTERQHVADDYSKMMYSATLEAAKNNAAGLRNLLPLAPPEAEFAYCPLLNISSCSFTENSSSFVVNVYNPLGRSIDSYVRVPVTNYFGYTVTDSQGLVVECQVVSIHQTVVDIPERVSSAAFELVFYADNLPPSGVAQFKVINNPTAEEAPAEPPKAKIVTLSHNKKYKIQNEKFELTLDENSMLLISVKTANGVEEIQLNQDWLWYQGMSGDNNPDTDRASGAYIFRPDGDVNNFGAPMKNVSVIEGPVVSEVVQVWSEFVSQILRLYNHSNYIELEWLVGPIPVNDNIGKEIIHRFTFDQMETNSTFYTDANGREMQKRILDYRPTWTLESTEPISQNYYPVTSRIMISSTNGQGSASVLNDRAQGGTSRNDGQIELMVHRRLLYDDAKGVAEPLNERAFLTGLVTRGKHFVVHSSFATPECDFDCLQRNLEKEIFYSPLLTFSSLSDEQKQMYTSSGLQNSLPDQLNLLSLEPWTTLGQWLLRLENYFEVSEGGVNVALDLQTIFTDWTIISAEEMMLGGDRLKSDDSRLEWQTENESGNLQVPLESGTAMIFTFSPMQIRTFVLNVTINQ